MNVHYLQHVPFEGLGYIETWLRKQQYPVTATRFYDSGYHLPGPGAIDALVIMGGPMSVYDEDRYPWLREEKRFIKDCILAGKKILGICLGAQLVAECLGGRVSRAKHKEIGWFPLSPLKQAGRSPGYISCSKIILLFSTGTENNSLFPAGGVFTY